MVQLVTASQFNRTNPIDSFFRGKQQRGAADIQAAQLAQLQAQQGEQEQQQALLQQVLGGQAPGGQPSTQQQVLGGQPQGIAGPGQGLPAEVAPQGPSALQRLAVMNPAVFDQVNKNLGLIDQSKRDDAASFAFDLQNTAPEQREAKIRARAQAVSARGGDAKDTLSLLDLPIDQQDQSLQVTQLASLTPKQRLEFNRGATPTALQQNLAAAGLQPGTPEFEQEVLRSLRKPGVAVTVGGKAESKEREELAKVQAKRFGKLTDDADNAESTISSLDQLDAIGVTTGALEPAKAAFAAVVEGFGIDASEITDVTTAQALNAVSNRLVNNVLNAAKGPQTEGDAQRARTTIRNLGDDPKAGQFKSDSLRAVSLRTIEQRDFIEGKIDDGATFSKARKEWNQFKKSTPSLSAVVKNPNTGLPMFFFQFKTLARQRRPDIAEDEIVSAWRNAHGGS